MSKRDREKHVMRKREILRYRDEWIEVEYEYTLADETHDEDYLTGGQCQALTAAMNDEYVHKWGVVPPRVPKKRICPECGGGGEIAEEYNPPTDDARLDCLNIPHNCDYCHGTGKIEEMEGE